MSSHTGQEKPIRLGAVSFLNTAPLTDGLADDPRFDIQCAVPSLLPEMLDRGDVDVALVPVIDLHRAGRNWQIVSDACIGCDGATLTVRVFSRIDPADVNTLHVDVDSHSSVALASVVWQDRFGKRIDLLPIDTALEVEKQGDRAFRSCEAVLLIGDKVINPPDGMNEFSTQIDLGAAWKWATGLPFVFAVWATPHQSLPEYVANELAAARDRGVTNAVTLANRFGPPAGWQIGLAKRYLTEYLSFRLTDRHRAGMDRFLKRAHELDRVGGAVVGTPA